MNVGEIPRQVVHVVRQVVSRGGGPPIGTQMPVRSGPDPDEMLQVRGVVDAQDGLSEAVPEVRLPLLGPPEAEGGCGMSDDIVRAWIGDRQGNPVPREGFREAPAPGHDPALEFAVGFGLGDYLPCRALESLVRSCRTRDPAHAEEVVFLMGRWKAVLESERKEGVDHEQI